MTFAFVLLFCASAAQAAVFQLAAKCNYFDAQKVISAFYSDEHQVGCNAKIEFGLSQEIMMLDPESMAASSIAFPSKGCSELTKLISTKPSMEITEYLSFTEHTRKTLPLGFLKFFPALKHFIFIQGQLKTLDKEVLEQFSEVLTLDFRRNELEYLPEDLFVHNKNLKCIELEGNKLQKVNYLIGLEKLPQLFFVDLKENPCINEDHLCYSGSPCTGEEIKSSLQKFQHEVVRKCIDTRFLLDTAIATNETVGRIQLKVDSLDKMLKSLEESVVSTGEGLAEARTEMKTQLAEFDQDFLYVNGSITKFEKTIERVYNIIQLATNIRKED